MDNNVTRDEPLIKFVGSQVPYYAEYKSIYPFDMDGHSSCLVKAVLEKFKWNYEGKVLKFNGEINITETFKLLIRNESDVSFDEIVPSYKDFQSIDYSHITKDEDVFIVSSDGSATSKSSDFAFASIYSPGAWIAWMGSFIFMVVFWSFVENRLSRYYSSIYSSGEEGLTRQFMNTYRLTINQDADLPPSRLWHLRLAVGSWILACLVLNAGFTGVLLSKLTLPPKKTYIETYEDILKNPKIKILVIKGTTVEINLKESSDQLRSQVWQQIIRFDTLVHVRDWMVDESFKQIVRGEMILILKQNIISYILPLLLDCDDLKLTHISRKSVINNQFAFPIRKNLDARKAKIIKRTVQSLFEADMIWRSLWFTLWENRWCFTKEPIPLKKLRWSSVRMVCFTLLLGYLISTIVLILEFKYPPGIKNPKVTKHPKIW